MATALNFTFEIIEVEDGTYGVEDETGRWNGIIGVLQRHEADLSVSAVTITYSRVSVIDFTLPFMHLGIAILVGKNLDDPTQSTSSTLFTFLEPFSTKVWIALAIAYLSVASMMWLLAKLSPFEWYDDVQRLDKMDKKNASTKKLIKNQFNLLNSLWFAVGSLMQQGSDVIPRAAATRTVAVIWWMFTLILISSYTAQLAAFLTVERMTTPVESSADLANQQRIKFGTLRNGSTMDFFRESKIPIYERMWSMMQAGHPTVFVNSSKEGIARVKKGNYAYMMESSMLEFYMGSDCNLQTVGGLLDSKGYGVALPKGSPLRNVFSKTILQLQERTILEALKNKWWQGNQDMSNCPSQGPNSHSSLHRVFGIFYVLFAGILVALLMAIGEFCIESESQRQSLRLELTWLGRFFGWFHSIRNVSQSLGLGVNRSTRLEVAEQPRLYGSTHNCGGDSTPTVRHARFQQRKRPFREDSPRLARQAPNLPWAVTRIDDYSGAGNGRQSMDTVTMSTNITAPTSKVSTPRYQRKSSEPIRRKTSSIPMIFNKLSTPSIQLTMDPNDPDFNLQRLIPSSDELLLSRRMSITSNIAPNMAVSTAGQPARL
ncbi:ligand-gated ion channel domain-containing protein [Ditylenchus destructor]|uniref:Ligand-gated ion channel domain-containing protein n=1 Tax=Ditylenchus destructor TaxID=166010 RepID=A0AAD4N1Q9_9BILA|nr:ligand-gated ion channel domain-containing protein [Ditylenchus destructor]